MTEGVVIWQSLTAAVVAASLVTLTAVAASGASSQVGPSPEPQRQLTPMLRRAWQRGPDLPQGFQDSDGGFLGTRLITVGGFCQGSDDNLKPGHYPRGFLRKVWALDVAEPALGWVALPDYPATPRQGLMAASAGEALYCWGGFNYTPPNCYPDGYRLRQKNGEWIWQELPPLPWPLTASGICSIGPRIYLFGGADYEEDFRTDADRHGNNPRLGARLLVFDTENMKAGWRRLSDCPGTPRLGMAMAAVGGRIYVIGGAAACPGSAYRNVIDNWRYDTERDAWERIRDLPTSSSLFPDGRIVFAERYIILVGGYQYAEVANPDGSSRPPYGQPHRFADQGAYFNDVFVYDAQTDLFGAADSMPINNATPMTVVRGDEVFTIGGEADGREIDGEYYGHHPDLFLRGKIGKLSQQ